MYSTIECFSGFSGVSVFLGFLSFWFSVSGFSVLVFFLILGLGDITRIWPVRYTKLQTRIYSTEI